jgi:hypothetical protein
MPNYLVCRDHGEAEELPTESDGNDDDDRMDEMVADIGREYKIWSGEQGEPLEVQNFYRLFSATDEKVHDGTDVTVLQAVTCLMMMKSKYNFSNQCYNDMVKLIIDLIPMKHNMPKDLYQSKKIMASLSVEYKKIDVCEKIACCSGGSTRMPPNVYIVVGPDMWRWETMMVTLLPQKWWSNSFITCLSRQGWNGCSCSKKQRTKWGGIIRKGNMKLKILILRPILQIVRLGRLLTVLILNLQGTQRVFILVCRWMVSNLTATIVICTLAD